MAGLCHKIGVTVKTVLASLLLSTSLLSSSTSTMSSQPFLESSKQSENATVEPSWLERVDYVERTSQSSIQAITSPTVQTNADQTVLGSRLVENAVESLKGEQKDIHCVASLAETQQCESLSTGVREPANQPTTSKDDSTSSSETASLANTVAEIPAIIPVSSSVSITLSLAVQEETNRSTTLLRRVKNAISEKLTLSLNKEPKPNFDREILEPLRQRQQEIAARKAEEERLAKEAAEKAQAVQTAYMASDLSVVTVVGTLTGSLGYALAGGNCINQVPIGLRGQGNPINWPVTTSVPYIGGAALWYSNHTGRVVGLWSNGDIEIAHENAGGWGQTRFPRSTFRGFR